VERRRLEEGDWSVTEDGEMFKRHWFEVVADYPKEAKVVRYWDLAATKPKKDNADPDWTSGTKIAELDGVYYIADIKRI
ncbi:hypothetical protein R0J90_22240, partial [Micrococcus sp. SIMBA_144]